MSPSSMDDVGEGGKVRPRPPFVALTIMTVPMLLAVAPVFLLGGLSNLVREDLGFDPSGLGLLTGAFFTASAITTVPGGRLADRIGPLRSVRLGLLCAAVSLSGIAWSASSWAGLAGWLLLSGAANGLAQPATNLGLVQVVRVRRQGLAFGVKQSAIPMSTLIAGVSVPLIGLTIGWRWAFAIAAVTCLPMMLLVGSVFPDGVPTNRRTVASAGPGRGPRMAGRGLVAFAVSGAFAGAAASSLATFYVGSVASGGIDLGVAGLLLSLGSVLSIGARLASGWYTDRSPKDPLKLVAIQFATGGLGVLSLGFTDDRLAFLIVATTVAFAAGWGWAGLLQFAVVRRNLDAPATATAMLQTGVYAGNVLGPIGFGLIVTGFGYVLAWLYAGAALVVSAVVLRSAYRGSPAPGPSRSDSDVIPQP